MKKISIMFLALTLLFVFSGCSSPSNTVEDIQKKGKLVMYTEASFPPFEYVKNGEIMGVDIDISKAIAQDLGVELVVKNAKFDTLLGSLKSKKADFIAAGLSKTPERLQEVDFSIEYLSARQSIISRKNAELNSLDSLKGKKIGVQTGTTSDSVMSENVKTVLKDTGTEVKYYSSPLDATQDLLAGRIDAVAVDEIVGDNIIQKETGLSLAILKDQDGVDVKEITAIAINKGNNTLVDAINKTLKRLLDEGKINEFLINHSS